MTAVAEFRIKLQPQPDVPALVVMRTRAPVLFDVVFIDYSDYGCSVKDKIVAVYSQFFMCDENLKPQKVFRGSRPTPEQSYLFFNIFLKANHFFTFRKSAYDKTCGINPILTSAVDQDLYLKLYETGSFKFVKKPLYFYRYNIKGVSQDKYKKQELVNNWHIVLRDTIKRRNISKLYS